MQEWPSYPKINMEGGLFFMVEKILENVVNEMVPHLEEGQLEHLKVFMGRRYATNARIWFPGERTGMKL